MKTRKLMLILIPTLSLSLAALAWAGSDEDDDARKAALSLTDTPEAVQKTVAALTSADKVTEVEGETDDGITVYEIGYTTDHGKASVVVSEAGEVIEREHEMAESGLPAAVRDALAKRFAGAPVLEADSVTLHYFEVKVKLGDQERELKILASGRFADDDESAEEDHDGDDEDHDGDDDGEEDDD